MKSSKSNAMKTTQRVIILGIDSLDPVLINQYLQFLPNIRKLIKDTPELHLNSIFPVDSIPAWVSIFTGQNPANHGIVKTFDVFDNSVGIGLLNDVKKIQGKTFWDYLAKEGKRTVLFCPLMAFPPWDVNGLMVSKGIVDIDIQTMNAWNIQRELLVYPPDKRDTYNIPLFLNGISGKHPGTHNLLSWSDDAKYALEEEFKLCNTLMQKEEWDLFFAYFSSLDIICHRFWRFSDPCDPTFPGHTSFENVIKDFYIVFDTIIGKILDNNPDSSLIILSDHGHGRRPTKVVNINSIIRENSLYYPNKEKIHYINFILEKFKTGFLGVVNRLELDFWLVSFSTRSTKLSEMSKNVYSSQSLSKKSKYVAKLSPFAGLKSYPHGGIEICSEELKDSEYENIREKIIDLLRQAKDPNSCELLMDWVLKREQLYNGKFVSEVYPDIVFKLKEEYGTGWNIYPPLISNANDHNLASGGHKSAAVLILKNVKRSLNRNDATIMDIAPTILDLMDIDPTRYPFDGKSLFQPGDTDS